MTNSLLLRIFVGVSLGFPVADLISGEKAIIMGFALTAVKKLNGAKLFEPSSFKVETTAIGLGRILPIKNL
jgi:hypothetical protein